MRLHRLTMTAIGPFADRAQIDLARFGESGLFLLEGPTGAGKSTVLDAISFALYGKLAQSTADTERLKSHHAPPGTEPVVELVFETQSGLYRIRRTPSYDRPKKRGTGTTPAHMSVKLWRLTSPDDLDGGELISASIGDAEDEITRAVGLTHAQFVQTVILPQGEFASFLRADTHHKKALLQRLFGTELLARAQAELVEARQAAERRRGDAVTAVGRSIHAYAAAIAVDPAEVDELAAAGDHEAVIVLIASVNSVLTEGETASAVRLATASEVRGQAELVVLTERDLDRRRGRREGLRAQLSGLDAAAEEVSLQRAELAAAERALQVEQSSQTLATAISRSEQRQDEAAAARQRLQKPLVDASRTALREACDSRRTTIGGLAQQLARERELQQRRAEHRLVSRQLAEQAALGERLTAELADLPARRKELSDARESAAALAMQRDALTAERDRAQARVAAARRAVAAAEVAARDRQLAKALFENVELQRAELERLRVSWRASVAGELGMELSTGAECVVCGSVEHPRPARRAPGDVSREQVSSAEDRLRALDDEVDRRGRELAVQQEELIALQYQADQLTPERAATTLDDVSAALTAATAAADQQQALDAELADLDGQLRALTEQASAAAVTEAGLLERSSAVLSLITRDETAVAEARAGFPTVADRVSDLTVEIALIDAAAAAVGEAEQAVAAAEQAGEIFVAALAAAEFADQEEWLAARRSSSVVAGLRDRVSSYDRELAAVETQLSTDELTDAALDAPPADLELLATSLAEAKRAESEATRAHGAAADRLAAALTHTGRVQRAVERGAAVLAETAPAIRVGLLVAGLGENQLKMELTTYVLVRRFADIVAAANTQLRRISGGRYELEHTADRAGGNARSGLGLRVLDLHTGRPRDPGTLSGGETFYVSLSLALGLADIVRAESGGIDLGTLFIDEGFGSLDPEVLDQVMAALDGLREGGRAVGVVSHVAELKARIADRIQVRRNADGSSRLTTTA